MIFKFILICFLLRFVIRAEDHVQRTSTEASSGARYCDFNGSRANYDVSDLLQCLDELATDIIVREKSESSSAKGQWSGSTGRQMSFPDIFANLFSQIPSLQHQVAALPVDTTSSNYQPNYQVPGGSSHVSPAFQLNLFDALSSISRHDDYKCIPRILCEMASGKLPGRSLGKQTSGFFDFLGRNAFTEWLSAFDVAGTSPLLNFGRAMILGYSNKGNAATCYTAFPRCPRDANRLVYYLNNYNGGFFRLFNRIQSGRYRRFRGATRQKGSHSRILANKNIVADIPEDVYQPGNVGNKIYFPVFNDYEEYEKTELQNPGPFRNGHNIIFPDESVLSDEVITNTIPTSIDNSPNYSWQAENIAFFPQETDSIRSPRVRFP